MNINLDYDERQLLITALRNMRDNILTYAVRLMPVDSMPACAELTVKIKVLLVKLDPNEGD